MIDVKIIEDSISMSGVRLATMQLTYPRYIHSEFLTHRVFSKNASSSRAIPVGKLASMALTEMVEPIRYGKNQSGMQALDGNLEGDDLESARLIWRQMAEFCAEGAQQLAELGLHKQWANRPLEWFSNIRVIVTATEWTNFFELRAHPDAQPEIQALAYAMKTALDVSPSRLLMSKEWHLPYVTEDERSHPFFALPENRDLLPKLSAARCCRVSYLKNDGTKPSIEEDLALCERLIGSKPIHASPFEHQARPLADTVTQSGNFVGWRQFRKDIEFFENFVRHIK